MADGAEAPDGEGEPPFDPHARERGTVAPGGSSGELPLRTYRKPRSKVFVAGRVPVAGEV